MIFIRPCQQRDQAEQLLARALPYDTGGPAPQLADMIGGCDLFELVDGALIVGAFAARIDRYSDGPQVSITAAGGLPGYDLVSAMDAWARMQAAGVRATSLTCTTRRPGLVRKLKAAGYQVAGYVMRKDL